MLDDSLLENRSGDVVMLAKCMALQVLNAIW